MRHRLQNSSSHPVCATLLSHIGRSIIRSTRSLPISPEPSLFLPDSEGNQRQAEIEQDLRLARDIQQGLLLEAVPRLPGWEISAVSLPARDLGGDLYGFLPLEKDLHGIMIGDVSGKGLPAALRMAVARTVFRHEARRGEAPGLTLASINRGVLSEIPQGMITMLYAILDTQHGLLRVANAGHNYPVLITGQIDEIELSGLPLGVDIDSNYEEVTATLHHGDTIFLYTDGVIEATNAAGELFGYERLTQLLQVHEAMKPRALVAMLLHELRAWSTKGQDDDITIVVLRRREAWIGAELYGIVRDVLGYERAEHLWSELPVPDTAESIEGWTRLVPKIIQVTQQEYGRGLARELNGQLRLALEEYRP